jgi:hypothetical protein
MADPSDSGCIVHSDGTLKDASEIEWHYNKDDDLPITPAKLHPFFTSKPAPAVMVAGSPHSACIVDPDNAINKGFSLTLASLTAVKWKALASVPSCHVSQKIHVDSTDDCASQTDDDESSSHLACDDSDAEGTENMTDHEFNMLQAMANADHEVHQFS